MRHYNCEHLLFVGVGGYFRGMAACMLANTLVGSPQEPMIHIHIEEEPRKNECGLS